MTGIFRFVPVAAAVRRHGPAGGRPWLKRESHGRTHSQPPSTGRHGGRNGAQAPCPPGSGWRSSSCCVQHACVLGEAFPYFCRCQRSSQWLRFDPATGQSSTRFHNQYPTPVGRWRAPAPPCREHGQRDIQGIPRIMDHGTVRTTSTCCPWGIPSDSSRPREPAAGNHAGRTHCSVFFRHTNGVDHGSQAQHS